MLVKMDVVIKFFFSSLVCCVVRLPFYLIGLIVLEMEEKAMDAEEAPGAREASECTSEAHQLRTKTEGGLAARGEGPGLTAFSDRGERPVAERLALLPRIQSGGERARRERGSNRSRRRRRSFSLKRLRGRQLMP